MNQSQLIDLIRVSASEVNEMGNFVNLNGKDLNARRTELSSLTQNMPLPVIALMHARSNFDPTRRTNNRHSFILLFLDQSTPGAAPDTNTSLLLEDTTEDITARMEQLFQDFATDFFSVQNIRSGKYQLDGNIEMTAEKNILATMLTGVSIRFNLIDAQRC